MLQYLEVSLDDLREIPDENLVNMYHVFYGQRAFDATLYFIAVRELDENSILTASAKDLGKSLLREVESLQQEKFTTIHNHICQRLEDAGLQEAYAFAESVLNS
jgi:hypothetical protein